MKPKVETKSGGSKQGRQGYPQKYISRADVPPMLLQNQPDINVRATVAMRGIL